MANKIKIRKLNHAYLQIECDDRGILMELSEFFTLVVPNAKFMPSYRNGNWDGKLRLLNNRNNTIYSGLYHHILKFAEIRDYTVENIKDPIYGSPKETNIIDENFIDSIPVSSKGSVIEPRDYQIDAVYHALKQKQALLVSPTASGKSLIIYYICRWFLKNRSSENSKILIIVPTTSLVEQMYTDFEDYAQLDSEFSVKDNVQKIYGGKEKTADFNAIISTWQSIYKLQKPWFKQFGMVMGDESHTFKAKSLISIMSKLEDAEYRFGTTGTTDGAETNELTLQGVFGPKYQVTTTKTLMDSGSLAKLNIQMLLLKYPEEVRKEVKGAKYQDEIDFIVTNEARNKFIRNLALDQTGNTLVLFQFVQKHGKPLHDLIRSKAADDRYVFYVSGETDVEAREQVRQVTETQKDAIIVASSAVFSTGINIKNIHNIVFASPSKSQIRVLQSIGRGLRKADDGRDTTLYDLTDDLHWGKKENYTLNHSKERLKVYSKERFKFQIHEVPLK